jgi:hypothetical protein
MADKYINQLNDFPANQDGYVVVGNTVGNGGGKKLLSDISNIPEFPDDADTSNYVLGIQDGHLAWVELTTDTIYIGSDSTSVDVEYK